MKTFRINNWLVIIPLLMIVNGLPGCQPRPTADWQRAAADPNRLHRALAQLNEVIVHDIFSPPVASRIYLYGSVAAYEAARAQSPVYRSLAGQLRGFGSVPAPDSGRVYCLPLASVRAFLVVGRALTFSGTMIDPFEQKLYAEYQQLGVPDDVYARSMAYGDSVAKHVMAYAGQDNYKQTRGFRYTLTTATGAWAPTPPAYMDAVEPNWFKIRPVLLDSAAQFAPPPPPRYDLTTTSPFYRELTEVMETGKSLTEAQREVANFWDCNPFKQNIVGHVMYATKKLSPGGHWMGIARAASLASKADYLRTTEAYARVSVALFDGFISCWDEKYRSAKVRPETVINQSLDPAWVPLLQTPPFPEYTSGHSVVSNAAAVVLNDLYGDRLAYADSTETGFGLPVRRYTSFQQAADEASISRLYGGIHYRSAIEAGATQGRGVGTLLLARLHTRPSDQVASGQATARASAASPKP